MMADGEQVRLGAVQETLFIPLAGRARETRKKRPILHDPKAAQIVDSVPFDTSKYGRGAGGLVGVIRTAVFDVWVRDFLAEHPRGTVVELGTGLNTRFERVDNGTIHWMDLDLPDAIELRRRYFTDTDRRQMVAASALDEGWLPAVRERPGPYLFVTEGVLVYLRGDDVKRMLARLAAQFPGALIALDTYSQRMFDRQQKMAAQRDIARWQWPCDDPRSLERLGLNAVESVTLTRPPEALKARLPPWYRYLLPLADPILGQFVTITLFRAHPAGRPGRTA
jgi:O-methyltransferase involved in polyketide biosynthesis